MRATMPRMKTVGILGGMGPAATVLLMQKIMAATPALDDSDHVPLLVDQNTQVPSRLRHLLDRTGDDPGPVLAAMAARLHAAGAQALAMPCNTAHHYAPTIRAAISVPFLDMVAMSVAHATGLVVQGGIIGILASPAVRRVGLFDAAFAGSGITPIYATDEDATLAAIVGLKAKGAHDDARTVMQAASADLLARGAAVQMIACTEFSLIPTAVAKGALAFDTLDLLVQAIIAFATTSGTGHQKATQNSPSLPRMRPFHHQQGEQI